MANKRSTNNEYNHYTQSNILIDNVPLSAHINNYLIKLIIPLNKTGQPPDPANFSNDSYLLLGSVLIGSSSSSGIPAALLSCSFFALACSLIRDIINNVFFLYNRGKCNKKRIIDGNSRDMRLNSSMGFAQCVKDFNVEPVKILGNGANAQCGRYKKYPLNPTDQFDSRREITVSTIFSFCISSTRIDMFEVGNPR